MGNTAEKNCLSQASSSGNDCNSAGTREVSTNNDTSETRDVSKQSATCMPHDNDLQSINDNITNSTASQQTEEERKDDQNDSCTCVCACVRVCACAYVCCLIFIYT